MFKFAPGKVVGIHRLPFHHQPSGTNAVLLLQFFEHVSQHGGRYGQTFVPKTEENRG